ncbi:hypothetical protein TNCT_643751 [Trichonephila clavata]|uniref:Uncharacterized protein n=1 Tax=Trichonephila clavata TaxID=2740835 RepID=A0A8X6G447_TRICU|nr:hypothetical protein TNCT_643751 [Trichonephila clavata]
MVVSNIPASSLHDSCDIAVPRFSVFPRESRLAPEQPSTLPASCMWPASHAFRYTILDDLCIILHAELLPVSDYASAIHPSSSFHSSRRTQSTNVDTTCMFLSEFCARLYIVQVY